MRSAAELRPSSPPDPSARIPPSDGRRWLPAAIGLFVVWTLATYALEGRVHTFLRPGAFRDRLLYALVANLAIGVIGSVWLLGRTVRDSGPSPADLGFRGPRRTLASIGLGAGAGAVLFLTQAPPTFSPMVLANGFAQAWTVSLAEVLVCWVAVGGLIRNRRGTPRARLALAWLVSAALFAVYHFAHSPPFNTPGMVALLGAVGLVTGAFYLGVGELYGTVVFHNFLALKGVTQGLEEAGRLDVWSTPQVPVLFTALAITAALVAAERTWIRGARNATRRSSSPT